MLHKRKPHLATEKNFVLHDSLKINKRGGVLIGSGGSAKNRKINKRPPPPPPIPVY